MLGTMNESIVDETRARLRKRGQLAKVAHETGLTYSWLTKFSDGRISNPTVRTLIQLIHYLDGADNTHHAQAA